MAKIRLAMGFAYFKQKGKSEKATKHLSEAIRSTKTLSSRPSSNRELISFQPERIAILAEGLLSHLEQNAEAAIQRRKNRIRLLEGFEKRLEDYATDLSTLAGQLAKDYSHLAVMYGKLNRKAEVHDSMNRALSWAAKSGELSDPNYYRTVLNIYAWAISSRALFEGYDFETLDEKISGDNRAIGRSFEG